jgi:hypothetical protein
MCKETLWMVKKSMPKITNDLVPVLQEKLCVITIFAKKGSLHMGDTTMTIYHNSSTKIHVIANDTGGARVAEITKIPASSNKNVRIRV